MHKEPGGAPLLEAKDIRKYYTTVRKWGPTRAVDGVSLVLCEGEILGLAGESGCGKSTLARVLCGLVKPTMGELYWKGKPVRRLTREEWRTFRRSVQMVFQDPEASLNPRKRIGEIVGRPLRAQRIGTASSRRERVLSILEQVQLSPPGYYVNKYPHQLSGGAMQRVGIARALALDPTVLIADEPIASLDMSIRGQILALLKSVNDQRRIAVVVISHDLQVLQAMCSRLAIMYLGQVVEQGTADEVIGAPQHHYTAALASLMDPLTGRSGGPRIHLEGEVPSASNPPTGCRFHPRCPHAIEVCLGTQPPLETIGGEHLVACHNPVADVEGNGSTA